VRETDLADSEAVSDQSSELWEVQASKESKERVRAFLDGLGEGTAALCLKQGRRDLAVQGAGVAMVPRLRSGCAKCRSSPGEPSSGSANAEALWPLLPCNAPKSHALLLTAGKSPTSSSSRRRRCRPVETGQ
jgi:hypothetical protein